MNGPILHYLIVFNHATDHQELIEFGENVDAALDAYSEKEDEFFGDKSVEVVLLGSDSIESIRVTHPNYFPDQPIPADWPAGLGLDLWGTSLVPTRPETGG